MKVRVLIVDDERPARNKLLLHLKAEADVEIVAEAQNGLEAVDAIRSLAPDLVFLDIQMPGMTGFEVIDAIGVEAMPAVVFVTAYDEYALRAFEVEAIDYLLKPFDEDRLRRALQRAEKRLHGKARDAGRMERLLDSVRPAETYLQRIVVKDKDRLFFVNVEEVIRLSGQENYVEIHTAGSSHLIRDTLNHLESRLDPQKFARIHRSEIVNIDGVKELHSWSHGDYIVILKEGTRLRLSRRYQHNLLGRFS